MKRYGSEIVPNAPPDPDVPSFKTRPDDWEESHALVRRVHPQAEAFSQVPTKEHPGPGVMVTFLPGGDPMASLLFKDATVELPVSMARQLLSEARDCIRKRAKA